MYNQIKKALYKVVPKQFLLRNEEYLRRGMYLFYAGKNHFCPVCTKSSRKFILNQRKEELCSYCGSMPRDRRLMTVFNEEFDLNKNIKLLDFSPSRSFYRALKKKDNLDYFPSDLSTDFIAEYRYDITEIPVEDEFFDAIICFHILEHVPEDMKAMKELYRVLSPKGVALVQTPFKEGDIYENEQIQSPEDRRLHFGQEDHVRVYSVDGLKHRLESVGFKVEVKTYRGDKKFGMVEGDVILKTTK